MRKHAYQVQRRSRRALADAACGGPGRRRGKATCARSLTLRPDNPVTETGVLSEFSRHGIGSRVGKKRADLATSRSTRSWSRVPWVTGLGVAYVGIKSAVQRLRARERTAA